MACADVDPDAAAETARLVTAEGGQAEVIVADVRDDAAVAEMVTGAGQALGGLDGVVCNVGIGLGRGLEATSVEEWDLVHTVNVHAHFLVCLAALPVIADGGAIVFISSVAGLKPESAFPPTTRRRPRWPG